MRFCGRPRENFAKTIILEPKQKQTSKSEKKIFQRKKNLFCLRFFQRKRTVVGKRKKIVSSFQTPTV